MEIMMNKRNLFFSGMLVGLPAFASVLTGRNTPQSIDVGREPARKAGTPPFKKPEQIQAKRPLGRLYNHPTRGTVYQKQATGFPVEGQINRSAPQPARHYGAGGTGRPGHCPDAVHGTGDPVRQRRGAALIPQGTGRAFPKTSVLENGLCLSGKLEIRGFERMETGKTAGACPNTARVSA
jgi:hypothetical protein